jgi:hypothetical protein
MSGNLKRISQALLNLVLVFSWANSAAGQQTEGALAHFKCELFTAENGALYRTPSFRTNYDNDVFALKVDSDDWVWVGTPSGLAVYDGKHWTHRTFENSMPAGLRLTLGLLTGTRCGPSHIEEGPRGTIWLGGNFGVWRFHGGAYEEVSSKLRGMTSMAADHDGNLWVVDRFRVFRYDGDGWNTVLCPYIGKPANSEAPGFGGVAIETNGIVWIGATAYGEMEAPLDHEGLIWIVDQEQKKRAGGPSMAPLFEFDGKRWRAFGPADELDAFYKEKKERSGAVGETPRGWATPQFSRSGHVTVVTPNGRYQRDGELWKPLESPDQSAGERWVLRPHDRFGNYGELFYRDGDRLVKVEPTINQTGEVLDLRSDPFASLHFAEDQTRHCVWLGTWHGLYRIWVEGLEQ